MNLFESIQQWIEENIVRPLTDRLNQHDKDIETLAARFLKLETAVADASHARQPTDLSFLAERVLAWEKRYQQDMETLLKRICDLETDDLISRIDERIEEALDNDDFRDRMTDLFSEFIEGDEATDKVKRLCENHLDGELDDLSITVKRG